MFILHDIVCIIQYITVYCFYAVGEASIDSCTSTVFNCEYSYEYYSVVLYMHDKTS